MTPSTMSRYVKNPDVTSGNKVTRALLDAADIKLSTSKSVEESISILESTMSDVQSFLVGDADENGVIDKLTELIDEINKNKTILVDGLSTRPTRNDVTAMVTDAYNAAVAHTDDIVKEYEVVDLYFNADGTMSRDKPIGEGTNLEKILTTTEELIYAATYVIPEDGVVLKDNKYGLNVFFNSISTSRITYIRVVYTVNDILVFDVLILLNNTMGEYELYKQIVTQLTEDIPYTTGTIAKLSIYGRVSDTTDRMEIVLGNVNKPSGLYRNAPISVMSASKITTIANGVAQSQENFNKEILTAVETENTNTEDIVTIQGQLLALQSQIDGINYVQNGVFIGRWDFFRQDPLPLGFTPLDGQLYTDASTKFADLIAYLTVRTNEVITEEEWTTLHTAASGIGGVPFYVYDKIANTLRFPDVREDSPFYGATGT